MRRDQAAVEQYLRRATRGLWGRKKREVREELQAHIEERSLAHRIGGMDEAAATERALAELGDPARVRAGMIRLHSLPMLAGLGAALAVSCVALISWSQSSIAQKLTPSFTLPTSQCAELGPDSPPNLKFDCFAPRPWLSVEELRRTLEPQDVRVTEEAPLVKLDFPGGNTVTIMEGYGNVLREEQIAPGHLDMYRTLHEIVQQSGLPVKFTGWEEITARVGDVTFAVKLDSDELDGFMQGVYVQRPTSDSAFFSWEAGFFYREIAHRIVDEHLLDRLGDANSKIVSGTFGLFQPDTTFDVAGGRDDVYAFVAMLDAERLGLHRAPDPVDAAIALSLAPANEDGSVTIEVPLTDLAWVDEWPTQPTPGTAMLMRLTATGEPGEYGHEIVSSPRDAERD